jgi:hypothetical protein
LTVIIRSTTSCSFEKPRSINGNKVVIQSEESKLAFFQLKCKIRHCDLGQLYILIRIGGS